MCGSALWVCLSLEDSWQSRGTLQAEPSLLCARNKTQKTEINKIQSVSGDSKTFLLSYAVRSTFLFCEQFSENKELREYSSGKRKKKHSSAQSLYSSGFKIIPMCCMIVKSLFDALLSFLLKA